MKLFVITSRIPFPLDKGDKLRVYHQLKELSKHHKIYLVVTHYRLKNNPNGKGIVVDENAKLEEELIVRPTL